MAGPSGGLKEHAQLAGHNETTLMRLFKAGLHRSLLDKIYALRPMPDTLQKLFDETSILDLQHKERQTFATAHAAPVSSTRNTPRPTSTKVPTPVTPTTKEPDVIPMDVDRNKGRFQKKSKSERPACWDCGQVGHFRGDAACPHFVRTVKAAVDDALAQAVRAMRAELKLAASPTPETPKSGEVFEEAHE